MNKLGSMKNSCAKAVINAIVSNKHLVHLDLSANNFSEEESKMIGESLEKNHTIYGFHFGGNFGFIDSKGFYKGEERDITSLHSLINPYIKSY